MEVRFTEMVITGMDISARMKISARTGLHMRYKGVYPTPPNPNMDKGRSLVIITTVAEVCWDNWRIQDNSWGES